MKKLTRKALLGIVLALIMVLGIPTTMNEAEARTNRLAFADPNEEEEEIIYLTADQMYKPYTLTAPEVTNTYGNSLTYAWEGAYAEAEVYDLDGKVKELGSGKTVTVIPAQCTFAVIDISSDNGYVYKMYAFVQVSYAGQRDGMIKVGDNWMYMVDGEPVDYTGMACNEYGWWYYQNGRLDWNYTGMANNEYGWWYYQNGRLDWTYTGMACNEYGWWYYQNGRLDWTYTGMACNEYGWWYYQNGNLDWNYTGMACNDYGWWYYQNGRLDWTYTGFGYNEYGTWLYYNGQIAWGFTGDWYGHYVVNGHVES